MADVFVSYSRRDADFVQRLVAALDAHGKDVWLDVEGIRDAEVFPAALRAAVEGSDGFVFVISPDSVASPFCEQEVDRAAELNKRVVPLLHKRVADERIPVVIRERNWIPFEDEAAFDAGVERLVGALDTDLGWTQEHTRWLLKALEWDGEGRDRSFLLRGAELAAAERWLTEAAGKQPEPTDLHREYLLRSRAAATRRLRALAAAMAVALAVAVALGVVALHQRNEARHQSAVARSHELAALSESQLGFDPELAILLASESVRTDATPQAMLALRRALDGSSLRATLRNPELVQRVAFSPSGDMLATAGFDAGLRLWRVRDGRLVRDIESHAPTSVAFSPDGSVLAIGEDPGGTSLFDPATGKETATFQEGDRVASVRYGQRGRVLVTAGVGFVKVWDAERLTLRRRFEVLDLALRAALSPDGRTVAAGTTTGLQVWDLRSGRLRRAVPSTDEMAAIAFSPDGATLAFGGAGGRVRLLDPGTGRILRTLGSIRGAHILGLAYNPDGASLAVAASDGTARLWDAESGRETARFEGHICCVNDVAFSADGRLLATSSRDHTAKVWAVHGNVEASASTGGGEVTALAFSPDGRRVIAGRRGRRAVTWTVGARSDPAPLGGGRGGEDLALSPDGAMVALTGRGTDVRLVDAASGRVLRTLATRAVPHAVAFDASGGRLAVGGPSGTTVFDAAGGESIADINPSQEVLDIAFAPRGDTLALASETGFEGATASLWKLGADFPFAELRQPNLIRRLAFSPDGRLLAGVTEADTAVKVWDVARRREVRELYGHTGEVTDVAFSPDGRLMATASRDRTVRVWDPRSGRQLRAIPHDSDVTAVAFSADGRRLATGDDRGVLRTWDACDGCFDARRLLALARERVTRRLTPVERRTFLAH